VVARAALRALHEEGMIDNAAAQGAYLLARLQEDLRDAPHVREVRGKGLLIGIELWPRAGGARRFCEALRERGVLCKDTHGDVIRLAPPLIIDRPAIEWLAEQLTAVLRAP
jgi:ornithine--oxo-acid transaminase